jgi:hypothetical protein
VKKRALTVVVLMIALAACNPLVTDPASIGGEFDQTAARYGGPDAAWVEVTVLGAPDHEVFAFALINNDDLHGPTARSCSLSTVVPCDVTPSDVRMPNQRLVSGDGSESLRLITVWSGETFQVILVCVDPETQELGCPETVRTLFSVVDEGGARVGTLVPATAGP